MWHPFKKVTLQAVTRDEPINASHNVKKDVSPELEKAQLRSLKARTEINMIYERLAESTILNMKGKTNAQHLANI